MLLNLLNLFSLIIALFKKIEKINKELDDLRNCRGQNSTNHIANATTDLTKLHGLSFSGSNTTTAPIAEATAIYGILHAAINDLFPNILPKVATIAATAFSSNVKTAKNCVLVPVNCSKTSMKNTTTTSLLTSLLAVNFATTILPEINSQLNTMEFSSTTTSTYTDIDFFYNSTIFDETIDNETVVKDANGIYSMGSTTALPFNGVMKYDYEATTPTYDEYYVEDSNNRGKFVVVFPFFFLLHIYVRKFHLHDDTPEAKYRIFFSSPRNPYQCFYQNNIPDKWMLFIKSLKIV